MAIAGGIFRFGDHFLRLLEPRGAFGIALGFMRFCRMQHPEVMLGVLVKALRRYRIPCRIRITPQSEISIENLLCRPPDFAVGTVAFKGLVTD